MEHLDYLIADLALILVSAGLTTLICKKIKQPVVLGYIVVGFLTGSNFQWFPTVVDLENIQLWADIGIIFLMFALGLEFGFQKLATLGGSVIVTTITVVAGMILVGYAVGQGLGWNIMDSVFLGGMISISSTMIILKAYEEYDLKKKKFSDLVFGVLILEDLVGIFMMIILSTLAVSKNVSGFEMLGSISILLLYLVLWLVLGIFLIPTGLKKASKLMNEETLLIVCLGICLGMVVLANFIGFSSALGAFIAGSVLAGTVLAEQIERLVKPIKDLFGAVFFVSVGMMVIPHTILDHMIPILIISITVVAGQMLFSGVGALLSGQSLHTAVCTAFSFVQIGEFSFIIATLGISLGVTSDFLYPVVVCVSVITTFITPLMIKNSEKFYGFLRRTLPKRTVEFLDSYTSEKRSESDHDNDWRIYLKRYFTRTLVCTAGLFVIYMFSSRYFIPYLSKYLPGGGELLELVIILTLMSPLISIMFSGRRKLYFARLWMKNPTNRLPLLALNGVRVLIAILFLILTIRRINPIPIWILIPLALVIIVFVEKSDFVRSKAQMLEARFVANYNERFLEKAKKERGIKGNHNWVDEKLFVVKFEVRRLPKKDAVSEFYAKKMFGIHIIKIVRDGVHINMPHATDRIMVGDQVFAMGTAQQIETYVLTLERLDHIYTGEEPVTLRDFMYAQIFEEKLDPEDQLISCAIEIPKKSPLARKSVKELSFRARYQGYIIGIERGIIPILTVGKEMVLQERDIIWLLGQQNMVDILMNEGLLLMN